MNNRQLIWLFTVLMILGLVGCGKKEEESTIGPAKETTSGSCATPIDPTTVGEVTGKITFEGARPKPQRINMDQDPRASRRTTVQCSLRTVQL